MNMRIHPTFAAVCAAFALAFLAGCSPAEAPVLNVEGGQIQGVASSVKGVYIYKGVPFAAPPVGELRWRAPQPAKASSPISCRAGSLSTSLLSKSL